MSQLDDAVARYNKLLETGPYRDLAWAEALHERMESRKLSAGGRLICPFLRPNFISRRQYESLVKTGEALIARHRPHAADGPEQSRLAGASGTAAGREDAGGRSIPAIRLWKWRPAWIRTSSNGHLHFVQYNADSPTGAGYADALADLFYDTAAGEGIPQEILP